MVVLHEAHGPGGGLEGVLPEHFGEEPPRIAMTRRRQQERAGDIERLNLHQPASSILPTSTDAALTKRPSR